LSNEVRNGRLRSGRCFFKSSENAHATLMIALRPISSRFKDFAAFSALNGRPISTLDGTYAMSP